MLQVPLQVVTWILRDRYIAGDEFTMNGKRMRLEPVVSPEPVARDEAHPPTDAAGTAAPNKGDATVISLADKKKR
jgi:hypothetical protein